MKLIKLAGYRRFANALCLGFCYFSTAFVLGWLLLILSKVFYEGLQDFHLSVFTQMTPAPGFQGGLANAIWGSLLITFFAMLIAIPVGLFAGTYLAEFAHDSWFATVNRFINDILLSAPTIVIGLFVYGVYVTWTGHFSGWAGVFALAIIAIPIIMRTTDNILQLVPISCREASAALGAPQWLTITKIVFRVARRGIVTGILLAIARISGETAPLLFTALNNQFFGSDLNKPMANLPNTIFKFAMSPYADWHRLAWQGSFLITIFVLYFNIFGRLFFKPKRGIYG